MNDKEALKKSIALTNSVINLLKEKLVLYEELSYEFQHAIDERNILKDMLIEILNECSRDEQLSNNEVLADILKYAEKNRVIKMAAIKNENTKNDI